MERPTPLISWVKPFPSRFINRAIFFRSALESFECACCLLSFLYFHCRALSSIYQRFLCILETETCFSCWNLIVCVSLLLTNYCLVLVTHLYHVDCLRANLWDQRAVRRIFHGQNRDQILPVISLSRHDKLPLDLGVLSITYIETSFQWTQSATPVLY